MPKLFITIILLFGVAVMGGLYLLPEWNEFRAWQNTNASLQAISAEFDELIRQKDALIRTINTISKGDLERIERSLPRSPQAAELLVFLENAGATANVSLKRVDLVSVTSGSRESGSAAPRPGGVMLDTKSGAKDISEFPFSVEISGSYGGFKTLLTDLEKSLRIVDVQSLSFGSPALANIFDVNLRAKTYYQQ